MGVPPMHSGSAGMGETPMPLRAYHAKCAKALLASAMRWVFSRVVRALELPSFLNAGFKERKISIVVSSRGDSSLSKMTGGAPFRFAGSSTGTGAVLYIL